MALVDRAVFLWGRLTAGSGATTEVFFEVACCVPSATPDLTAICCLRRLYCLVKSVKFT